MKRARLREAEQERDLGDREARGEVLAGQLAAQVVDERAQRALALVEAPLQGSRAHVEARGQGLERGRALGQGVLDRAAQRGEQIVVLTERLAAAGRFAIEELEHGRVGADDR